MTTENSTMSVFCQDQAHLRQGEATPRRAEISLFECHGGNWIEFDLPWHRGHHEAGNADLASQTVTDGVPLDELGRPQSRKRFRCPLCARTVPARGERLQSVFTKLAAAGVADVSLAALAPILCK